MRLYNTLARKVEKFKPIKKDRVGIYSCGPTVYWNQHIGHMYAYVQWDTMVRIFNYLGYKTKWVMNITDVGHMTSDEDAGEDKMEKGARREGLTVWQIADKYIKQFLESMDLLNVNRPDVLSRATEHIQEQIDLIKKIEENGFTYRTKMGVVLDTGKFPDYAKFANLNLKKQRAGSRLEVDPEKKVPWDPFLWVTGRAGPIMQWDSPWERGFPGWHIECTAMSTKYLGEKFDIHTGGKEHIPVHHTNEIAQGFGAFGAQTANFWLHNEWLVLKGEKMSKSLGNMYLVTDLIEKGYDPLALRYLILTSHYRSGLDFTWESLKAAQIALERLKGRVKKEWNKKRGFIGLSVQAQGFDNSFKLAIANDLQMPQALAVLWTMVDDKVISEAEKYELLLDWDRVLGLKLGEVLRETRIPRVPREVKELIEERKRLRKKQKWAEADEIRKKVEKLGWEVEDTPKGPKIKKLINY